MPIFAIHKVKMEEITSSSSVSGNVRTGSYTGVSGSTDTTHQTDFFCNGKVYSVEQINTKYPFRSGDNLLLLCGFDGNTGIYKVQAFINLDNGTRSVVSRIPEQARNTWVFGFLGLLLLPIGLLILSFAFYNSFWGEAKKFNDALEALNMAASVENVEQQGKIIENFNKAA